MGLREYIKEGRELAQSIKERDPAARSLFEVQRLYPGYKAVMKHRRAHWFYKHELFFIARYISQRTRRKTGIEIHPGAIIGKRLFIDHGMGVVIGETAEVGDDCVIYHGVTLGGTGKDSGKRHPTLGDNILVGCGAKILGPIKIGSGSKIAAGSVVLHDMPENSTAVGVPAKNVKDKRKNNDVNKCDMNLTNIPDPVEQEICLLKSKIFHLENSLNRTENDGSGI